MSIYPHRASHPVAPYASYVLPLHPPASSSNSFPSFFSGGCEVVFQHVIHSSREWVVGYRRRPAMFSVLEMHVLVEHRVKGPVLISVRIVFAPFHRDSLLEGCLPPRR